MLKLERTCFGFDLETTGIDPQVDRIVQIGVIKIDINGDETSWTTFVNPEMPIPKEATEAHSITNAMVETAPTFKALAPRLAARLQNCDYFGYNVKTFDIPFLEAEFKRAGVVWSCESSHVIDAFKLYTKMYPRNLTAFVQQMLGIDMSAEAHDAGADILWTLKGFKAFLEKHPQLPRTAKELHELAFPIVQGAVDRDGRIVFRNGVPTLTFGKHKGKALHFVPVSYLQWLAGDTSNAELKKILTDALAGKFPVEKRS